MAKGEHARMIREQAQRRRREGGVQLDWGGGAMAVGSSGVWSPTTSTGYTVMQNTTKTPSYSSAASVLGTTGTTGG